MQIYADIMMMSLNWILSGKYWNSVLVSGRFSNFNFTFLKYNTVNFHAHTLMMSKPDLVVAYHWLLLCERWECICKFQSLKLIFLRVWVEVRKVGGGSYYIYSHCSSISSRDEMRPYLSIIGRRVWMFLNMHAVVWHGWTRKMTQLMALLFVYMCVCLCLMTTASLDLYMRRSAKGQ